MVKRNEIFIILGVLVIASVLILGQSSLLFGSIVSSGQINFDEQGNTWVASLVVNTTGEKIRFTKTNMVETFLDGSQKQAQSDIDISFRQLQPYCTYDLAHQSYGLKTVFGLWQIGSVPYLELRNPTLSAPFRAAVFKNGVAIDSKEIDVSALGQTTTLMANGDIKINGLGQLSGGINCPDASGALLIPIYQDQTIVRYEIVDRAQWLDMMLQVNNFLNMFPPNLGQVSALLSAPPVAQPSSFYNTVPRITEITEASTAMRVDMPKTATVPFITIEIDADLADTLTFYPSNPKPQILSLILDRPFIEQSEQTQMTVTIKNIGTDGSFDILPYNTVGYTNFQPVSDRIDIGTGATGIKTFTVYGLVPGSESVCVKVIGVGSGVEASRCASINIADNPSIPDVPPAPIPEPQPDPQPETACGNGDCEWWIGENPTTCAMDCAITPPEPGINLKEECLSRQGDGIFVIQYNWTEPQLLGQIAGSCDPVYNWSLIILAIIAMVGVIGGIFVWKVVK